MMDEPGPKEAALREMREARLKQVMKEDATVTKTVGYAGRVKGREGKDYVKPRPRAKGYGPATREAKPPPGKRRNKGAS